MFFTPRENSREDDADLLCLCHVWFALVSLARLVELLPLQTRGVQDVSQSLAVQFKRLGCYGDGENRIMTDVIKKIPDLTKRVSP